MFTEKDLSQINARGANLATIEAQIEHFKKGFPYLKVIKAATIGDGVIQLDETKISEYVTLFDKEANHLKLLKFVPASGAASRMFKSLFAAKDEGKFDKSVDAFFGNLKQFAFYKSLKNTLSKELANSEILENLLTQKGLDYGNLPKGLLEFHKYGKNSRTPAEEHLVEGANYANSGGKVRLHFTVSPEHRAKFNALISKVLRKYKKEFGVKYDISFSEQKPSTDTIAVGMDNTPFRQADGSLLFRPAGHGALLENLNDQKGDIIFIKNVDNVVPDHLKSETITYKKALAGILIKYQNQIFDYLKKLDESATVDAELLNEIQAFLEKELCVLPTRGFSRFSEKKKLNYFKKKLNRPLRVCGMVKNVGEPGGGPFWAKNPDGTTSLQIAESAQIDLNDTKQKSIFEQATHFNPVDLICSLKNYKGKKFNLLKFRDMQTGFITQKSQSGRDLKAQELPGLWNGSMSDWNTLFVEVPLITFNPVKTVNDLLRKEHQG